MRRRISRKVNHAAGTFFYPSSKPTLWQSLPDSSAQRPMAASPLSAATARIFPGLSSRTSWTPTNSSFGPTSTAFTPRIPTNLPKRASCMSSATRRPTPLRRAARKFSTRKFFLSPPKPKWSFGFATLSIRRRGARASARSARSRIREQRRRIPFQFVRFQLNKAVRHEFPISKRRRSKYAREATGEKVAGGSPWRSEEHTSELQSHSDLVCRLLLEKKKNKK